MSHFGIIGGPGTRVNTNVQQQKRSKSGQVGEKLVRCEALASPIEDSREIKENGNTGFGRVLESLCDSWGNR
jgi:hypothetical protein